jgi:phosphatidylserine decarboxylase
MSQPAHGTDTPSRVKRLASRPLKLAASTFRPLTNRTNSSASSLPPSTAADLSDTAGSVPPPTARRGLRTKTRIRHLRSRDTVPANPTQLAAASSGPRKPLDGEEPAAVLRVRVVRAENLVAKDRNGTSDPYVPFHLRSSCHGRESS